LDKYTNVYIASGNKKGAKSPLTLPWIAATFIIYFPKEAKWATRVNKAVFLNLKVINFQKTKSTFFIEYTLVCGATFIIVRVYSYYLLLLFMHYKYEEKS